MKLGDTIKITGHYVRISRSPKSDVTIYEWKYLSFPEPRWGIFLGYRTLHNGSKSWKKVLFGKPIEGAFVTHTHVRAMLVCTSSKSNPFYTMREK